MNIDCDNPNNYKAKLSEYAHSKHNYYAKNNGSDTIVTPDNVDQLIAESEVISLIDKTKPPQIELYIDPKIYGPSVHTLVRMIKR